MIPIRDLLIPLLAGGFVLSCFILLDVFFGDKPIDKDLERTKLKLIRRQLDEFWKEERL
jgi:hypothetical protein